MAPAPPWRRPCRTVKRTGPAPRARTVSANGIRSACCRPSRITCESKAATGRARAIAGSTIVAGLRAPETGNQPSPKAKTLSRTRPIQNTGDESTTSSTPAAIPRPMRPRTSTVTASASTAAITRARIDSCIVAPSCLPMTSLTGIRNWYDSPRSPLASPPMNARYCSSGGRSSPSSARMPSLTASLTWACGPSMTDTGSPGITRNARKASVAAPQRTARADAAIPAIRVSTAFTRFVSLRSLYDRECSVDAHIVEQRATVQVVRESRDALADGGDGRGAVQRDDRDVLRVPLLHLGVELIARILIARGDGLFEQRIQGGVRDLRGVLESVGVQVVAQEVGIDAGVAPVGEVERLRTVLLVVGARLEHLAHDLEADLLEIGLDGVGESVAVIGHRGPRDPSR